MKGTGIENKLQINARWLLCPVDLKGVAEAYVQLSK